MIEYIGLVTDKGKRTGVLLSSTLFRF